MRTKLSVVRDLWASGDHRAALAIVARFPRLGQHKRIITRGQSATLAPDMYRQMGYDPEQLVAAAYSAMVALYDLNNTSGGNDE